MTSMYQDTYVRRELDKEMLDADGVLSEGDEVIEKVVCHVGEGEAGCHNTSLPKRRKLVGDRLDRFGGAAGVEDDQLRASASVGYSAAALRSKYKMPDLVR